MKKLKVMGLICVISMMMVACASPSESSSNVPAEGSDTVVSVENNVTVEGQTIGLEKVQNARQLGGYITTTGMKIKMNKVFRTGKLDTATTEDLKKLADRGLHTIIDLRTTTELSESPDPEIPGVEKIHIKIHDESGEKEVLAVPKGGVSDPGQIVLDMYNKGLLYPEMYVDVIENPISQAGFREFLQTVAKKSAEDGAILYHCTSGKDRVGVATVLLLSILEVDTKTIMEDFALTNAYNEKTIAYIQAEVKKLTDDPKAIEGVAGLAGVVPSYMENALNCMDEKYGSPMKYITDVLGITETEIDDIRRNLLEPVV